MNEISNILGVLKVYFLGQTSQLRRINDYISVMTVPNDDCKILVSKEKL